MARHCNHQLGVLLLQASISLVRALAAVWAVSEEHIQQHIVLTKPALQTSHSEVSIGRAVLPLAAASSQGGMLSPANANKVSRSALLAFICHHCLSVKLSCSGI